jgi:hypothetical protein
MLRYCDIPAHTTEVLDLTSLTGDELTVLVSPFEAAFLSYMAEWTLHGRRRQARRYTTYKNCPLPTPDGSSPHHVRRSLEKLRDESSFRTVM